MFLPVLLIRDFGPLGWVIFAIPNVAGAAAMGFTLRTPEHAKALQAAHLPVARLFSLVTVAFQMFFFGWFGAAPATQTIVGATAVGFALAMLLAVRFVRVTTLAAIVWAASAAILVRTALLDPDRPAPPTMSATTDVPAALGLAASCGLGFLLCPYLDLTFLNARANTGSRVGRWAFPVGFGTFFLAMIAFTYLYSGRFGADAAPVHLLQRTGDQLVAGHIAMQLAFTIAVHQWSLRSSGDDRGPRKLGRLLAVGVGLAAGLACGRQPLGTTWGNLTWGEFGYRTFMSFYGLTFPAYVWLCMVPTWTHPAPPTRRQLVVTGVTVAAAAPLMWMAFIERQMVFALPAVALVLLARLFIGPVDRSAGPGPLGPSGAPTPTPPTPPPLAAAARE